MEIEVKRTIYIDLDEIIEENHLTKETSYERIRAGVNDYVSGLDDCDYYALDYDHITAITEKRNSERSRLPKTGTTFGATCK